MVISRQCKALWFATPEVEDGPLRVEHELEEGGEGAAGVEREDEVERGLGSILWNRFGRNVTAKT
jgi:hypothetical protein